ncbi:MAG TPA: PxKF domain-containing protein [Frankiaceae bacterium]|nr:PxKF domain-containing protein [Frankiaceae bacterium]
MATFASLFRHAFSKALALALITTGLVVLPAAPAQATHFRFRQLTWRYDHAATTGNVVELTLRLADRRSFYGSLSVGSSFSEFVSTGDGGGETLTGQVVAVNAVDDWFIAEVRGFHTYALAGPYTVSWESCCTLSSLRNSPDSSLRTTTVVNTDQGNSSSPVSLVSPIVNIPATGGVKTFPIPATDPDGHNVTYRLATQSESLVTQPPGLSIDSRTGVVSWDTTNRARGLWMVTVILSDPLGASTMNTFLINLGGTASNPPSWVAPTPPDHSNLSVETGSSRSFTVSALDPDGDRVFITPLTSAPGLSCATVVSGSRTDVNCTWTPIDTGTHLIAFDAQDANGASAGLRTYRVTAPRYVAMGDSFASGEGALHESNYEAGTNQDAGGNGCRRATTAYPYLVAAEPTVPGQLQFVACSGARTWHMYDAQHGGDNPQPPQFDMAELGTDVELVTVSIGGNDAGFSDILKECILGFELLPWNDCAPDKQKSEYPVQDAFARLRGETPPHGGGNDKTVPLKTIFRQIREEAPRARVLVVGYPQFFKSGGTSFFTCSGVSKTDQKWVNSKVKEMNDLIREEAESLGLEFVYTSDAFSGHRLCEVGGGESREWFRDITFDEFDVPDPSSFHPDDDGHIAMKNEIMKVWNDPPEQITLTTGELYEFFVQIEDILGGLLSFSTSWPGSDVEMTLTSPSGVVYRRSAMPAGTTHLLGPTYEIFQIPNPEAGQWKVSLYGASMGADGEPVTFSTNSTPVWNTPPEASIAYQLDGKDLHLDATASSDPDGDALVEYHWFLNDENGTFAELTGPVVDYTFDRAGDFGVSLEVIDSGGKSGYADSGVPITVAQLYQVVGPLTPLDATAEWTIVQPGRTIPVRWRLTRDGVPVNAASSFVRLSSRPIDCASGVATGDVLDGDTAGTSGLSYHGDGTWQYNWQSSNTWRDTCRLMMVTFDDGSTLSAKFSFK